MKTLKFLSLALFCLVLFSCKKEKTEDKKDDQTNNTNENSNYKIEYSFAPGESGFDYNSPIIKGNFLYIGTSKKMFSDPAKDNKFYKFDLQLNVIWSYNLDSNEVRGSAALDSDDNIYFTVQSGRKNGDMSSSTIYVYSLSNSGTLRWKKLIATGSEIKDIGAYELNVGDKVYVQGADFYALSKTDGTEAWKVTQTASVSKPLIDNSGNIYMVQWGCFMSIDPNGAVRWKILPIDPFSENGDATSNASFADAAKTKIVFCYDVWMYNINCSDGSINWKYNPPHEGFMRGTPAIDAAGNMYIGRKNHNKASAFYKVKHDGSAVLWSNTTFGEIYTCSVLANDSTVFFASELLNNGQGVEPGWNRIHVMNINTGKIIWQYDLGSDVGTCSPAMSVDGKVYVGTIGYEGSPSKLVCIKSPATGTLPGAIRAQFNE
ncbi:MAG: PQQ-binding-like beta-propeller repeat protein [Bacteroidetes bacterium]|nr:PQQ-binding-like beta-propeller repeat protein [Bacteroidota bacterium]